MSDVSTASTNTTDVPLTNAEVTSIDYSGGMDLTSYAGSSYLSGAVPVVKPGIRSVVDTATPADSPALLRTMIQAEGVTIHPGGSFWKTDDADYKAVLRWIQEGAQDN